MPTFPGKDGQLCHKCPLVVIDLKQNYFLPTGNLKLRNTILILKIWHAIEHACPLSIDTGSGDQYKKNP